MKEPIINATQATELISNASTVTKFSNNLIFDKCDLDLDGLEDYNEYDKATRVVVNFASDSAYEYIITEDDLIELSYTGKLFTDPTTLIGIYKDTNEVTQATTEHYSRKYQKPAANK